MSSFQKLREKRPKHILLVTPTSPNDIAKTKWFSANLGIERLAGFLNAHGHSAETYDTNYYNSINNIMPLDEKLRQRRWDIVGVSVQEDTMIHDIGNLMLASELCPGAVLVAGGHTAQFDYQTILDKSPANLVVIGEGEKPLLSLAEGKPIEEIPGIVLKNSNQPLTSEEFKQATQWIDYEHIPYEEYWDYYLDLYKKNSQKITSALRKVIHTIRIYTKNYCPMKCSFCSTTNFLKKACDTNAIPLVGLSPEDLINLLKRIIKAHPRVETIYFTDDDFCSRRKHLKEFLHLAAREQLPVEFFAFSRIDDLDDEIVSLMVKAGFRSLHIGIESFQPEILKELKKKVNLKTIDRNLDLLNSYGIKPSVTFILCTPNSKLEWVENTAKRILHEYRRGRLSPGINVMAQPQLGSRLYEENEEFESHNIPICNSNEFVRRHYFIKSKDPEVREFQYRFLHRWGDYIKSIVASDEGGHLTSPDQTPVKLELILEVIAEIKSERGSPNQQHYSQMSQEKRHELWLVLSTYKYGASL